MKCNIINFRYLYTLSLMFLSQFTFSQVGIGTSSPNPESVLDLSGVNNKGLVLPTTTSTNPFNATGTKEGMLMFNTNNKLIYYSTDNGTALNTLSPWTYVPGTGPSNHISMMLSKNVGIGTNTPKVKFHLIGDNQVDYSNNSKGYLMLGDHTAQHLVFDNQQIISKSDGITPSELYIQSGGNVIISNNSGNVGIGKTPSQKLDVDGNINSSSGKIKEGGNDLIPAGVIVMWSGTTPPAGWALCDGSISGRPDLRGRFIVGYNPNDSDYTINKIGGSKTHEHSIPDHNHTMNHNHSAFNVSIPSSTWGGGDKSGCAGIWQGGNDKEFLQYDADGTISADPPDYTGNTGTKTNLDTNNSDGRPPYFTLAYIIKL